MTDLDLWLLIKSTYNPTESYVERVEADQRSVTLQADWAVI